MYVHHWLTSCIYMYFLPFNGKSSEIVHRNYYTSFIPELIPEETEGTSFSLDGLSANSKLSSNQHLRKTLLSSSRDCWLVIINFSLNYGRHLITVVFVRWLLHAKTTHTVITCKSANERSEIQHWCHIRSVFQSKKILMSLCMVPKF